MKEKIQITNLTKKDKKPEKAELSQAMLDILNRRKRQVGVDAANEVGLSVTEEEVRDIIESQQDTPNE